MYRVLALVSVFIFTSCFEAKRECKSFRTGKFRFDFEIKGQKKTTFFERFETIEVETFEGKTDTSTIRWVNDCEYILQKLHPKNREEKKAISMRILNTSKNSYTFEFGIVGSSKKQIGTAIQLK